MGSGWSIDLTAYANVVTAKSERIFRKIALDLCTGIIMDTPVLSGRARGNWIPSIGAPNGDTVDRLDTTGLIQVTAAENEARQWKPITGYSFYLTNNLPYIERLENGHSKEKAPDGMVAINVSRFGMIADAAAREEQ